jgi:hypothetical protein
MNEYGLVENMSRAVREVIPEFEGKAEVNRET